MNPIQKQLEENLAIHLTQNLPYNTMSEAYHYAVLPAGKLFRPSLTSAIWQDTQAVSQDELLNLLRNHKHPLSRYCSAIEIHHAYTLVHDDLPCMDDDDLRRGRLATHKKYGQWQALLAGDGLLSLSHQLIAPLQQPLLHQFFCWATGPKGLILGQYLDLSTQADQSLDDLILIHKLKTARLIQASLAGGYLLAIEKFEKKEKQTAYELFRLGHALGIAFQLIDDLTELKDPMGAHEQQINPWPKKYPACKEKLQFYLSTINKAGRFPHLYNVIEKYLEKMQQTLDENRVTIEKKLIQQVDFRLYT